MGNFSHSPRAIAVTALLTIAPLAGCTIGNPVLDQGQTAPAASSSALTRLPGSSESGSGPLTTTTTVTEEEGAPVGDLASIKGATIYLDPGHAGVVPPASVQVTDGRGGMKPCNTSGASTNDGYPEHTFNWEITQKIKAQLEAAGATVQLTRDNDTGRQDCIDERALKENASNADAVVSIHADGATSASARGFHVSSIAAPLPDNDADGSTRLAEDLRDAMLNAGMTPSTYLGANGLYPRSDLTGLNLSTKPKALVEFGNMRHPDDAAMLRDPAEQDQLASAIVAGLADFLGGQ